MAIQVRCRCGQRLVARDEFASRRAQCPLCGCRFVLPAISEPAANEPAVEIGSRPSSPEAPQPATEEATSITEFLDPPNQPIPEPAAAIPWRRMFEALLDPRSIQWMLVFGGGLAVLGLVVWLTSLGFFENRVVLAVILAAGTLSLLAAGGWVVLKTRFRVAGQALTFLACVVAPLNLWFYHAQGLLTLDNHLWVGGLVCALLYATTVYVLRDPLFLYAVELGITLTAGLLLADLGLATDITALSFTLAVLGIGSIHAERAFPTNAEIFARRRFGLPLFWSGHAQFAASLVLLLAAQILAWLTSPEHPFVTWNFNGGMLTHEPFLATGLWLAGVYTYLYSDLVVRRVGIYVYLAAFCFIMAEATLLGLNVQGEWFLAILAVTALSANVLEAIAARRNPRVSRLVLPLAMALSGLPVVLGIALHLRATSDLIPGTWRTNTGWSFVGVMVLVAACNRISALLCRKSAPRWSAAYFFASAAAIMVAAAGLLRQCGFTQWSSQAPWLMLLPIAYMAAARFWRGHSPERPLSWVAHATTLLILVAGLGATCESSNLEPALHPRHGVTANLLLAAVFAEAAIFYVLAAAVRRRNAAIYFAAAAACGALWQFLGYADIPMAFQISLYAVLGVAFLAAARWLGIEELVVYRPTGWKTTVLQGRGLSAFQVGNMVAAVASLAALLFGLSRLALAQTDWPLVGALLLTMLADLAAAPLVPKGPWRRIHLTAAVAVAAMTFLAMNVLIHLTRWQKLEIFSTALGLVLMLVGYVRRFREEEDSRDDAVTLGLWLGSVLGTLPLLVTILYSRMPGHAIAMPEELSLLAVTVLMVVTGYGWQVKSTTLFGGSALVLYLVMLVVSLGWRQQLTPGVMLAVLGLVVFGCGIVLSIYRQKLLELPEQIARHEGVFRMLDWR